MTWTLPHLWQRSFSRWEQVAYVGLDKYAKPEVRNFITFDSLIASLARLFQDTTSQTHAVEQAGLDSITASVEQVRSSGPLP